LNLWKDAKFVLTDSGGLQEETTALGVPCITVRENTERPITVEEGTNVVAGTDPEKVKIEAFKILEGRSKQGWRPALWDGKAPSASSRSWAGAGVNGRIEMMGCQIDNLSMEETLQKVEGFVRSGRPHQHVAVNVDKLGKARKDPELRRIINQCALINVDGMPVVWASKLLGSPLKERVTGIDLFESLVKRAAEKGWRVFFSAPEEIRAGRQGAL